MHVDILFADSNSHGDLQCRPWHIIKADSAARA